MAVVLIWDPLERLLGGIAITLGVISTILYLYRSRERKGESEGFLIFGFAILISGSTVLLIFYYFLQYYIPGSFTHYIYYIDSSGVDLNYQFIERLGWIIFFIIYSIHIFAYERTVIKRTKYTFTLIIIVFIVLMSFTLPFDYFSILQMLCYGFLGIVITLFLIIITRMSKVEFKAVTAFILASIVLISMSIRFLGLNFKELNIIPLFLPQLFIIIGSILTMIPILIRPSRLTKANYYWYGNLIIIFMFLTFTTILYILLGDIIKIFIVVVYVIIAIYAGIDTLKSIRLGIIEKSLPVSKSDQYNVLELFIRPKKLTEEEVTISKEKKVCLVCKMKLERSMYICPECHSFYCRKCSNALKDLENACWVCSTRFDESKPSKPFQRDEKEEKIEISDKF